MKKLTDSEIRAAILEIAKAMYDKGMVNALEGNVSYRDGDRVYITPSGICKGYLTTEMIAVVNMSGEMIEGDHKPSSELKMHLACYKLRDDVKAVIHTHSPYATAHAIANKPIETKAYPEMIIAFDKVPVVKYGTPSTDEIHEGIADVIFDYDVFMIANHGIVSVSPELFDAFFRIEAVENIARVLTITKQLGGEHEIPPEKFDVLYEIRKQQLAERKERFSG